MANITLGNNPIKTIGNLPEIGDQAKDLCLIANDLSKINLNSFKGSRILMNIFPSIDTEICAISVKKFNEQASQLKNTKILCISRDLPFSQKRFCGSENIDNVITLSDFADGSFGKDYGLTILDGVMSNLHSRCIIIIDESHKVIYTEQLPEIAIDPNYAKALSILK